jgi:hypothetical protein
MAVESRGLKVQDQSMGNHRGHSRSRVAWLSGVLESTSSLYRRHQSKSESSMSLVSRSQSGLVSGNKSEVVDGIRAREIN